MPAMCSLVICVWQLLEYAMTLQQANDSVLACDRRQDERHVRLVTMASQLVDVQTSLESETASLGQHSGKIHHVALSKSVSP